MAILVSFGSSVLGYEILKAHVLKVRSGNRENYSLSSISLYLVNRLVADKDFVIHFANRRIP